MALPGELKIRSINMQHGLVSVMMPAYNAEPYVRQAIESLLDQSYSNWELVFVDDGSTDGTADVATSYSDPRIKIIHQDNRGESAARNMALKQLCGDFVAFLDADDAFMSHHLEVCINYMRIHHLFDGVYTDGYYCNQDGIRLKLLSERRRGPFTGHIFEEVIYSSNVFGPPVCVVLRRDVISENKLRFDEAITIGPDWVFLAEFAELAQFGYVDEVTCLYRVHELSITARVDLQRRSLELAKCRMKFINLKSFGSCSVSIRAAVFYDLLINLLKRYPERQHAITKWSQFRDLPNDQQARLFRLMASEAMMVGIESGYVERWLDSSRRLNPADKRGALLSAVYQFNPSLCKLLLRVRRKQQTKLLDSAPFADLVTVPPL